MCKIMLFVGAEKGTASNNTTLNKNVCKPFWNKPKVSTVLMSSGRLYQVLTATYRIDLWPALVLKVGSARKVFVDDRNVLVGT